MNYTKVGGAAVIGVLILLMASLAAQADNQSKQGKGNFADRVAGSYVIAAYLGESAALPVQAMATLAADGGVVATDTDDYGFEITQDFHSPKHGSWARTGKNEIALSIYEFGFSATDAPGYTPIVVYKLVFVVQYDDKSFDGGAGVVNYAAHLLPALDPEADPLDLESGALVAVGEGTVEFRRLAP